jgi:hypothetical protein
MDLETILDFVKRPLLAMAFALIALFSLHSLGFGWKSSLIMALLPAVLGTLNIFTARIFVLCSLTMVAACINAFVSDEDARTIASPDAPSPLASARASLDKAGPIVETVAARLAPAVDASASAATGAATAAVRAVTAAAAAGK